MPSLALWTGSAYENDELFKPESRMNRDGCLACFHQLKARAEALGWECHTKDIYQRENRIPDVILFLNIPRRSLSMLLDARYRQTKRWVVLWECAVVRKQNWSTRAQGQFDKIFTWHDALVDNDRFCKIHFSQDIPWSLPKEQGRPGFCTMIVANKHSRHPLELYSERLAAIRWFEVNHPDEFALYGFGWDKTQASSGLGRLLPRRQKQGFLCYRGTIAQKMSILRHYKFAFCYENARDIPGYITEKIIDCLIAGCVPIYLGANNITEYIPAECFIDKRQFNTYEDLYAYLKQMDASTYQGYKRAINDFLTKGGLARFSSESFAEAIYTALARN